MDLIYRVGCLSDLDEIELLVDDAIEEMKKHGINQWDDLYPIREEFEDDIKKGQLFVGLIEGKISVIYTLNNEADAAYEDGKWQEPQKSYNVIHRLCVNPKFQNQKVAKRTMTHIEESISAEGVQAIRLDIYSLNPYALKLYTSCGYTKVGEVKWRKGLFYLMEKYM
ncbi:GNAT family N-acetyltransferase [Cellulosilyticum ruminicola]|uniref:GNAT family N-acetyltransferase n=1 Tax=Cellulosilyticum ruminicola TaxID=425254 RepID=UPI0006CFE711|nr:GNAT family N-acetyltransferase [Cellulosilyticum ruminicola]